MSKLNGDDYDVILDILDKCKKGPTFSPELDSLPLMRELAKVADIPEGRFTKITLVLEINKPPKLYTEGFIAKNRGDIIIEGKS